MASQQDGTRLKLIHLVYGLLVACVIAGIAIGRVRERQIIHTEQISAKVEKEVFELHQIQQREQMVRIDNGFVGVNKKLDKIIEQK